MDWSNQNIKRLSFKTIFLLSVYGSIIPLLISLLFGSLSLFGMPFVHWNNNEIIGISGLLLSIFIGLIFSLIFILIFSVSVYFGMLLVSRLINTKIHYEKIETLIEK